MVPRIGRQGSSFRGAGLYHLRDKDAATSERVAFTHTENLPTDDPQAALRYMAWTAMNAERLKRESGAGRTGARSRKPVWTLSLSWAPGQEPTDEHMIDTMNSALAKLGLKDRQTLMVAHNDEDYRHLHAIVNLIGEDGKSSSLSYSREKLSRWAEAYEREHGKIYCEQRVENNAIRKRQQERRAEALKALAEKMRREANEQGRAVDEKDIPKTMKQAQEKGLDPETGKAEFTRYKDPQLAMRAEITRLYKQAQTGEEFRQSLEAMGYRLATGRRLVLVDREGQIHSVARQIQGEKPASVREKLKGLELPSVEEVRERQSQETGRAQKQAADIEAKRKEQAERQRQKTQSPEAKPLSPAPARKPPPIPARAVTPRMINALQDRHAQELSEFRAQALDRRLRAEAEFERLHGERARRLRADIAALEDKVNNAGMLSKLGVKAAAWAMKLAGKPYRTPQQQLEDKRRSLENIEWRRSERWQGYDAQIAEQEKAIRQRQERERQSLRHSPPAPANQNRPSGQFERVASARAETAPDPPVRSRSGPSRERG